MNPLRRTVQGTNDYDLALDWVALDESRATVNAPDPTIVPLHETPPQPGLESVAARNQDLSFASRLGVHGSVQGSLLRLYQNFRGQVFTRFIAGGFASFGQRSVARPPLRLHGERAIRVGSGVFIGPDCWLQTLASAYGDPLIEIGDGTSMVGADVISAVRRVSIGRQVLLARNVYIADHGHESGSSELAVLAQGVTAPQPVSIGDGSWLGQNVVILPGTELGKSCVVGANSVVKGKFPDRALIVGAPGRLVRTLD